MEMIKKKFRLGSDWKIFQSGKDQEALGEEEVNFNLQLLVSPLWWFPFCLFADTMEIEANIDLIFLLRT